MSYLIKCTKFNKKNKTKNNSDYLNGYHHEYYD